MSEFKDENVDLESAASSEAELPSGEAAKATDEPTADAAEVDVPADQPTADEPTADVSDTGTDESAPEGDLSVEQPAAEAEFVAPEEAGTADDAGVSEVSDETESVDREAEDPLEEFRAALRSKPGDWYVVHTYSGMEKRVKANLENRITSLNMEDFIYEVHVPQEDVWEVKNGQRKQVSRTVLPGYVLVRMDLTDESWSAVRHTPSVTGFVGHSHQPVPLSLGEVEAMLAPTVTEEKAAPAQKAQAKVEFADFAVDDSVLIVDGAFATLHATITEINVDAQRVKALVEIFGRETPVELSFSQIQKV